MLKEKIRKKFYYPLRSVKSGTLIAHENTSQLSRTNKTEFLTGLHPLLLVRQSRKRLDSF